MATTTYTVSTRPKTIAHFNWSIEDSNPFRFPYFNEEEPLCQENEPVSLSLEENR